MGAADLTADCTGRLVDRTEATAAAYRRRYEELRWAVAQVQVDAEIEDVIIWFCTQDGRWSASTIRQYRAAIAAEVARVIVDTSWRESLLAQLRNHSPAPKVGGPRRTSARKRKSLPEPEVRQVVEFLRASGRPRDRLIANLLLYGIRLFPRPGEWVVSYFVGATFVVPNAKNTNGRANGDERERDLSSLGGKRLSKLRQFLVRLRAAAGAAGGWARLHGRLSSRLARVCRRLGIRRIALYTVRHVGIATAKLVMPAEEVAACAGHASVLTAASHYAKARHGWKNIHSAGPPSPASLVLVRWTKSPSRRPRQNDDEPSPLPGW